MGHLAGSICPNWPVASGHGSITVVDMRSVAALRRGRSSLAGQCYLVTFTTPERVPHFADADVAMRAASRTAGRM